MRRDHILALSVKIVLQGVVVLLSEIFTILIGYNRIKQQNPAMLGFVVLWSRGAQSNTLFRC